MGRKKVGRKGAGVGIRGTRNTKSPSARSCWFPKIIVKD